MKTAARRYMRALKSSLGPRRLVLGLMISAAAPIMLAGYDWLRGQIIGLNETWLPEIGPWSWWVAMLLCLSWYLTWCTVQRVGALESDAAGAIEMLRELRVKGVEIRNRLINQAGYKKWKKDHDSWGKATVDAANKVSRSFGARIQTLDRYEPYVPQRAVNSEHQRLQAHMSERLLRIEDLLKEDQKERLQAL